MRPGALRPATAKAAARQGRMRTRLAAGEKPNRKRMATLTCVYDAEPAPRRPHDIIAPPGGRNGSRTLRPRPKARAKWLAGSVEHDPASMIAAAFSEADARDPHHQRTWVVLVDGAEHQLDLIRAGAQRRGVTIHVVIDLIHVLEYIWKAAWSLHAAGDPAAEDWVAVKALAVLAGDSARAAAEITAQADAAGLTGTQRAGADACVRYLTSKHDYLRYDQALAAGWPIATGVIEGACRHLIGDRLDITGARWGLQGAEAVLTLRAVIANGDYPDVCVMPKVRAGPAGGHGLRGPRDRDNSEAFEEGEQRVAGSVAAARDARGCHSGQGLLLQFHVGMDVRLGRFGALVAEPECEDGDVDACVQQAHRCGYLYLILKSAW